MRARLNSSFTYADRAGNIFYVWNASIPALPQPSGGDSVAVPVHRTSDAWTRYVDFDSLPQLLNPKDGYVQNSNDPPYYTNMHSSWTGRVIRPTSLSHTSGCERSSRSS